MNVAGAAIPPSADSLRLVYIAGPSESPALVVAEQRLTTELKLAGYSPAFLQPGFQFQCRTGSDLVDRLSADSAAAFVQLFYSSETDSYSVKMCITRTLHGELLEVHSDRAGHDLGFLTLYVAEALYGAELSGTAPLSSAPTPSSQQPSPPVAPSSPQPRGPRPTKPAWRLGAYSRAIWVMSSDSQVSPLGLLAPSVEGAARIAERAWLRADISVGLIGGYVSTPAFDTRMRGALGNLALDYDLLVSKTQTLTFGGAGGFWYVFNPTAPTSPAATDGATVLSASATLGHRWALGRSVSVNSQLGAGTLLPRIQVEAGGVPQGTWGEVVLQAAVGVGWHL